MGIGGELVGVLRREVAARIVDVSASGCRLEVSGQVARAVVCELRLLIDGEIFVDHVRITRCVNVRGSGARYSVGAEFLWTTEREQRSLRRLVTVLRKRAADVSARG